VVKRVRRRRPTMLDVARLAGVSQTAVSFVLSEAPLAERIPEETRDRIREAVRTLGYRPNASAKVLRTGTSDSIGFITDESASNPFSGGMIVGAQRLAWDRGKMLIIVNTEGDPAVADAAVEIMLQRHVEGIIYAADYHQEVKPPAALAEVPSVLLDCFSADRTFPSVVPDEVGGARLATEHLLAMGHRRVGFINVHPQLAAAPGRLAGYRQALAHHDLPFDPALVRHATSHDNADEGYVGGCELLALPEPPTALFCATDRMAMGAYDAIRERGLRISEDVAVVGFDDQQIIARFLRPALTTVALPHRAMGEWAVQYLLTGHDATHGSPPVQHLMPCPLVVRGSAGEGLGPGSAGPPSGVRASADVSRA
jgi:LacI family transcriptional regulator